MRTRRAPHALWLNIALLIGVLIVCGLVVEGAVRVLGLAPDYGIPQGMARLDPLLGYRLVPDFTGRMRGQEFDVPITLNDAGFRDDDFSAAHTGGILVLGDSFQFGNGVRKEQVYTEQLEERLANNTIPVLNFGVEGWGPAQELLLLNQTIAQYKPRLVIVSYFIGNDIQDTALFPRDYHEYHGYIIDGPVTKSLRLKVFVAEHCKSCLFAYRLLSSARYSSSAENLDTAVLELRQFSVTPDAQKEAAWRQTIAALQDMQRIAHDNDAAFLVVLIPSKIQCSAQVPHGFVRDLPNQILVNQSFPTLDLMSRGLNDTTLYFVHDGHWNVQGHTKAADVLWEYLAQNDVLS